MRATGAVDPRRGRTGCTGRSRRSAALSPVLWGAGLVVAAVGLVTTAHAADLALSSPGVTAGSEPVRRCASSDGLDVTPVLEPEPAVVAYRVTAVTVTGLTGCAGHTVQVTVRGAGDLPVAQASGTVPSSTGTVVLPLTPARLDPVLWTGWAASVSTP